MHLRKIKIIGIFFVTNIFDFNLYIYIYINNGERPKYSWQIKSNNNNYSSYNRIRKFRS
jgi:hypothetical protein